MTTSKLLATATLLGLLQAPPLLAAQTAPPAASLTLSGKLSADQALLTAGGTQFTGPLGWSARREEGMLVMSAPENDAHLALVEVAGADPAAAVKAAWARYRPTEAHAIKLIANEAARDGWDQRAVATYEVSPNEKLVIFVQAMRKGAQWTVAILDGHAPTFEKRGVAVSLMLGSVRPAGHKSENFSAAKPHPLDAARIASLRAFVAESMQQLGIPGVGLALLENGKIVYEGGIGVREVGKSTPVDANTLFMAASNTKGMSTLLLAKLADEGKLRWDQPVTQLYPAFKLGNAATTSQVLVKHLVCACTGLPRQDLEWLFEYSNATPASSMALLGTYSPTTGFGELYQYNNLMAAAAGYVGGHVVHPTLELGKAYDKAMQAKIFDPIGMKSTTFDFARALRANHATPHSSDIDNQPRAITMQPNYSIVAHRPAGGVWTSAHDFIRYVQLEATAGKLPNGKQLVSSENLLMRRKPQVSEGEDASYGMGLSNKKSWGLQLLSHGGSMFGFKSNFYLLPETGTGLVILTNSDDGWALQRPVLRRLVELLYDAKPEAAEDIKVVAARNAKIRAEQRQRLTLPADPEVVGKLAKTYRSAELGDIAIRRQGLDTIVDIGEWQSVAATRKNDDGTVSLRTTTPGLVGWEFVIGTHDGKRALVTRAGQHEYKFVEYGE